MKRKEGFFRIKKAEQEAIGFMWLFFFIVISFVIGISVLIVYSESIDTRALENKVIFDRVYSCLINNGFLTEELFREDFDIYDFCSLDKEAFEKKGVYYFNLEFYNSSDLLIEDISENPLRKGDFSFQKDCEVIESGVEFTKGIVCLSKKINFLFYENNEIQKGYFNILMASNNKGGKN